MTKNDALIRVSDCAFSYEGAVAVRGLNFEVRRGDFLCIVGENGSGKSTLIRGLLRLKAPSSGKIIISHELHSDEIGYMPQQTPVQKDFPAAVFEVVLSGRLGSRGFKPFYSRRDKLIAEEKLHILELQDLRLACYRELSIGQQQRVLLARALCATGKLILLDEPAAGLDPIVTREFYALIEGINRDLGLTVIMVTHDIEYAARSAGNILHLKNKQVFFGARADYLNTETGRAFIAGGNARD